MILNIRSKLILSYLAMAVLTVLASAYAVGHLRDLNKLAFTVIHQDFQLLETEKQMMETLEMAKMAAEVKNYGKTLSGSNYVKKEDMDARTSG